MTAGSRASDRTLRGLEMMSPSCSPVSAFSEAASLHDPTTEHIIARPRSCPTFRRDDYPISKVDLFDLRTTSKVAKNNTDKVRYIPRKESRTAQAKATKTGEFYSPTRWGVRVLSNSLPSYEDGSIEKEAPAHPPRGVPLYRPVPSPDMSVAVLKAVPKPILPTRPSRSSGQIQSTYTQRQHKRDNHDHPHEKLPRVERRLKSPTSVVDLNQQFLVENGVLFINNSRVVDLKAGLLPRRKNSAPAGGRELKEVKKTQSYREFELALRALQETRERVLSQLGNGAEDPDSSI